MQVTHTELQSWHLTANGQCRGMILLHGDDGARFQVQCEVPRTADMGRSALNAALAQEAMRQLCSLPEFRNAPPKLAPHAIPLMH